MATFAIFLRATHGCDAPRRVMLPHFDDWNTQRDNKPRHAEVKSLTDKAPPRDWGVARFFGDRWIGEEQFLGTEQPS